ncbi:hypothetical protein A2160_03650 [Candidatus Beckwithbacteria bacterium RBG_13_42_9]|uniref:peptidylprolyl isomerase n=1 Tax=Candidatus Beckwithbacteria bacterium RBG_13_42_9 TaxID=1797457 RepID=A0A1F5E914_9BACT|nr:MAG: hypothetical protein A2160_03650 [Candidatus Beckwithbacteria bacterium RBG_13_42_9]
MPKTRKKTSKKKIVETSGVLAPQAFEDVQTQKKSLSVAKIAFGLGIILLLALAYYYKNLFVVAMVNNQPITRLAVISELEKKQGKQALDNLVTESLIIQEAQKQKVSVTTAEENNELTKIEDSLKSQNMTLEQALQLQGMTKDDLLKQIKIQKIIEKILGKDIQVTDDEVNKYLEDNKDSMPKNPTQDELNKLKDNVKQQLIQQKLGEKFQTWLDDLKSKAKIDYFLNY